MAAAIAPEAWTAGARHGEISDAAAHSAMEGRPAEARRGVDDCSSAQVGLQSAKQDWPTAAASLDSKASAPARWPSGGPASQRAVASAKGKGAGPAQAPTPARAGKGAGKGKGDSRRLANEPSGAAIGGQIAQLKEMGFSEKDARQALAECVWDVNKALDLLFTRGVPMGGAGDDSGFDANASATLKSVEVVVPRECRGGKGARPSSPVASKKASAVARSGGNSPIGNDSAEHSTTASTASSPRSAGFVDRSEKGTATAPSQPSSPQATGDADAASDVHVAATVLDAVVASPITEAEVAVVSTMPEELLAAPPSQKGHPPLAEADVSDVHKTLETETAAVTTAADDAQAPPRKRAERVARAWATGGTELGVDEGDFVLVWTGTMTEHGWIYAEDVSDCQRAGWLPDCVLQQLPSHQRWMRAGQTMEAVHETQLGLVEGSWFKVSVETRTAEGWAYAETMGTSASTDSGDAPETVQSCPQAGWVPVCGLEWTE